MSILVVSLKHLYDDPGLSQTTPSQDPLLPTFESLPFSMETRPCLVSDGFDGLTLHFD